MARKKSNSSSPVKRAPKKSNSKVQNGLSSAIGWPNVNDVPGFGNNPFAPQISQTNTLFLNMRWYLVSNFRQPLSEAYVELGLVQTVVDVPVDDGLRGGIEIQSKQLDENQIQELLTAIDRDDDLNIVGQAAKWNRLFGGAGILIIVDDQDPQEPLDISSITKDTLLQFRAVDMWELFWDKQNTEGYDPEIQTQEFEHYNYYSQQVHKSRVMRLTGVTAPSFIRPRLRGWGFSVVEVLIRSINQYLKATDLSFEVLDEFKVDFYKIKNLVNSLLSPDAESKIARRIQQMNWQKNYQNAVVMDSEDEWDHRQLSFAGLAETMMGIRMQVAADMRMPITKLFGTSASAGIGNTDQNDMENYNSMVESQVRNKLKYHILQICEMKCQQLFGMIPDDLKVNFKPLRVLSAEQEEVVKTQKFTRLLQARQTGEISSQEFKDACNKDNLLPVQLDTSEDVLDITDHEDQDFVEEDKDAEKVDEPGSDRITTQKPYVKNPMFNPQGVKTRNSAAFDRASYEADGGDNWTTDFTMKIENPGKVDEALWAKAKEASQKAFGHIKWPFVSWFYKKQGGKFH